MHTFKLFYKSKIAGKIYPVKKIFSFSFTSKGILLKIFYAKIEKEKERKKVIEREKKGK